MLNKGIDQVILCESICYIWTFKKKVKVRNESIDIVDIK